MDRYLYEITCYYQGQTTTNRVFAPDKETAIAQLSNKWVEGVEILKVEQLSFTPARTGAPLAR